MAWFFNGRKYWYHNGKRYSRRIKRKFKKGKWVKVNYSLSKYKKDKDSKSIVLIAPDEIADYPNYQDKGYISYDEIDDYLDTHDIF